VVRTKKRIDYETVNRLTFTVVAYDSGIPQKSATAYVTVNVININDMDPVFSEVYLLFNLCYHKGPSVGYAWPISCHPCHLFPLLYKKIEVVVIILSA
jgi:hypothetical protein